MNIVCCSAGKMFGDTKLCVVATTASAVGIAARELIARSKVDQATLEPLGTASLVG